MKLKNTQKVYDQRHEKNIRKWVEILRFYSLRLLKKCILPMTSSNEAHKIKNQSINTNFLCQKAEESAQKKINFNREV